MVVLQLLYPAILFLHILSVLGAIASAAQAESSTSLSPALSRLINNPVLLTPVTTSEIIGLGVICLMVVKPDLIASLAIIVVSALLGLACSAPSWQAR
ncbi:MAG TPA: hypothetical protein VF043_21860, partial [Ktedonobacteraceae bacterium]